MVKKYFINHSLRVLIVHPREDALCIFKDRVEQKGWHVECTTEGLDALFMTRNLRFDLIITNLQLQKITGIEFIRSLRMDYASQNTTVLFIGDGNEPEETIHLAARLKALIFSPGEMIELISRMDGDIKTQTFEYYLESA